jgi:hypothetical protein
MMQQLTPGSDFNTTLTFIYVFIEERIESAKLKTGFSRKAGFAPRLSDSENITIDIMGALLGLHRVKHLVSFFKNQRPEFFPQLPHRTTFFKQSKALGNVKEYLHEELISEFLTDFSSDLCVDSCPVPVAKISRKNRNKNLKDHCAVGYCAAQEEKFYGFRLHAVSSTNGMILSYTLAPADVDERDIILDTFMHQSHLKNKVCLADKGYISAEKRSLAHDESFLLTYPTRSNMKEKNEFTPEMSNKRRIIETIFSQLKERFKIHLLRTKTAEGFFRKVSLILFSHALIAFQTISFSNNIAFSQFLDF